MLVRRRRSGLFLVKMMRELMNGRWIAVGIGFAKMASQEGNFVGEIAS
jgi:hypothetical protein